VAHRRLKNRFSWHVVPCPDCSGTDVRESKHLKRWEYWLTRFRLFRVIRCHRCGNRYYHFGK
jgi:hypothetical protein